METPSARENASTDYDKRVLTTKFLAQTRGDVGGVAIKFKYKTEGQYCVPWWPSVKSSRPKYGEEGLICVVCCVVGNAILSNVVSKLQSGELLRGRSLGHYG